MTRGASTPWGESEHAVEVAPGIVFHETASHGGYYVDAERLHKIPLRHQAYAKRWSGSRSWYEEDCAWAAVCLAYPEAFPPEALGHAQAIDKQYMGG